MVNTRSRTVKNTHPNMNGTDRYSDAESESSVPEVLTREQMNEFDDGNLLDYRNESEHHTVNQRFNEMNKQISELTSLVIALTEKISSNDKASSSNREGNNLNTVSIGHETRSDSNLASFYKFVDFFVRSLARFLPRNPGISKILIKSCNSFYTGIPYQLKFLFKREGGGVEHMVRDKCRTDCLKDSFRMQLPL